MVSKNYFKRNNNRDKELLLQRGIIASKFPEAKINVQSDRTIFELELQPSPASPFYKVLICYPKYGSIDVWATVSNYENIKNKAIPHIYSKNDNKKRLRLCLYYGDEFKRGMSIAETLIPWAAEWLYFYELWLASGKWLGGGIHGKNNNP